MLPDLSVQIWDPRGQRLSRIASIDDEPVRVMTTIGKTLFMGREDGSLLAYDTKDMKTSTIMQVLFGFLYFGFCSNFINKLCSIRIFQAHKGQLTVIGANKFFILTADDSGNLKKWDFYNITKAKKISKKRKREDSESDSEWN